MLHLQSGRHSNRNKKCSGIDQLEDQGGNGCGDGGVRTVFLLIKDVLHISIGMFMNKKGGGQDTAVLGIIMGGLLAILAALHPVCKVIHGLHNAHKAYKGLNVAYNKYVKAEPADAKVEPPIVRSIFLYDHPNDDFILVSEGGKLKITMTHRGFNSNGDAQNGLSEIVFRVNLNNVSLLPASDMRLVQDSIDRWHINQEYLTEALQKSKGTTYSLTGATYRHPSQLLESRRLTIVCN